MIAKHRYCLALCSLGESCELVMLVVLGIQGDYGRFFNAGF